jgi:hypothetical protein
MKTRRKISSLGSYGSVNARMKGPSVRNWCDDHPKKEKKREVLSVSFVSFMYMEQPFLYMDVILQSFSIRYVYPIARSQN